MLVLYCMSSSGMSNGINRKDELFNTLLEDCQAQGIGWTNDNTSEGNYTLQVS